jgi:hypothetical protein
MNHLDDKQKRNRVVLQTELMNYYDIRPSDARLLMLEIDAVACKYEEPALSMEEKI